MINDSYPNNKNGFRVTEVIDKVWKSSHSKNKERAIHEIAGCMLSRKKDMTMIYRKTNIQRETESIHEPQAGYIHQQAKIP